MQVGHASAAEQMMALEIPKHKGQSSEVIRSLQLEPCDEVLLMGLTFEWNKHLSHLTLKVTDTFQHLLMQADLCCIVLVVHSSARTSCSIYLVVVI